MKSIRTIAICVAVCGMVSCSQQPDIRKIVEEAAIKHAMKSTKLPPQELKIKSIHKKEGNWQVIVSQVPEVPSGYIYLSVTVKATVENTEFKETMRKTAEYFENNKDREGVIPGTNTDTPAP